MKVGPINVIRFERLETCFNASGLARAFTETVSTRVRMATILRPVQIDGVAGTMPYAGLHAKSSAVRKRTRTMRCLEILWREELMWFDNMR